MRGTFTFTDDDGRRVTISLAQVEAVAESTGRVHDEGHVVLVSGRVIRFRSGSTAAALIEALRRADETEETTGAREP